MEPKYAPGEGGLDGAVVRAVVGQCALACLEARGPVLRLERDDALNGARRHSLMRSPISCVQASPISWAC